MAQSEHGRPQRVAELLGHELARLISTELKDPRVGFVTVTEVRMSNDLRSARVYVSIYGDAAHRQASLEGLSKAAGYLRHELGPALQLRRTPELFFCLDESLDRVDRLETLLQAVKKGDVETPGPQTSLPVEVQTDRSALAQRRREFEEAAALARAAAPKQAGRGDVAHGSHKSAGRSDARGRAGQRRRGR